MGGGDKPLVEVGGKPMLAHAIERLAPQVDRVILNANGDPARFARFALPVVPDTVGGFAGPLAGILAGMRWTEANMPDARAMVSVAADTPFFPADLVTSLSRASGDRDGCIALAASAEGTHPVFGLWPVALADDLAAFLTEGTTGKILAFVDRHSRVDVTFPDFLTVSGETIDPFFNVNTPDEAARAQAIAGSATP
jgi:molybdopterin-guanine dinucleotide biosynthesis protein A